MLRVWVDTGVAVVNGVGTACWTAGLDGAVAAWVDVDVLGAHLDDGTFGLRREAVSSTREVEVLTTWVELLDCVAVMRRNCRGR